MLISPLTLLGFLLIGTAVTYLVAARWPRYIYLVGCTVSGLGILIWLALGQQLPLVGSAGSLPDSHLFPAWHWQIDNAIWSLSGILLLLVFSLLLFRAGQAESSPANFNHFQFQLTRFTWQPVLILALTVTGLAALWAATLATFMVIWTLLAILWTLYVLTTQKEITALTSPLHRFFWMLMPLLFAGIAAATEPGPMVLLDMGNWTSTATTAILLASMAQMGVMPLVGWRPRSGLWSPSDGPILHLFPSLVGAGLLVRLVTTGRIDAGIILLLTVFALISILSGIHRSWAHLGSANQLPADMAYALSGLAFLAGIWAGSEALEAGVRLLVLTLTPLFLLARLPISRARWWRGLAPMLALLSLAGFPMTVGFTTLAPIYNVWFANNLYVLILALILLLLPLITAALVFVRIHYDQHHDAKSQQFSVTMEVAQLSSATGLIMLGSMSMGDITLFTWLALLATAAGALLLARYVSEVQEIVSTVDTALSADRLPFASYTGTFQRFGRQVIMTLSEAAFILEGDRGLLWLTAFLAILLFMIAS
jgi:hypothetical protein